ncbi:MAG: cytidine deaminase [Clostridia bacterium]|nr:cytidine deaminase [Clostridia bacterium]
MNSEKVSLLVAKAIEARESCYAPYSKFAVGAALLCADGTIYTGANIENASYTPTVCAERVAFFTALHNGHRDFSAIAIVGGESGKPISEYCPPCGVCRQVMGEFCKGDFKVILSDGKAPRVITLDEIFPSRFDLLN